MDNKWLKDLKSKVANYESSKKYQDYCWKVYHKNEVFIKELIKWRTVFNIKPGSTADKALAFFIHKIWQEHGIKWRTVISNYMAAVRAHPPGMYSTFLAIYLNKYSIRMIEELLAGKVDKHYVSKDRIYSQDYLTKWLQTSKKFDANRKTFLEKKKVIAFSSPPIEFLPEWYFIARPSNKFYQDENLEIIIRPLIDNEIAEDKIKTKIINQLNELLQKHAFQTVQVKKTLRHLKVISMNFHLELILRELIRSEKDLDKVKKIEKRIEREILIQQESLEKAEKCLLKQTVIPDKLLHEKVYSIINKLKTIIQKELK